MRGHEHGANQLHKRGVVVDRDPATQRVRVKFDDEDGIVSGWLDVLAASGGSTKTYAMPNMDDEVWCALDPKGEDGCILGVKYNDKTAPPFTSNDQIGVTWADGSFVLDTASGAVTITSSGPLKIVAGSIELESATLTHNGKNVGHDHTHGGVLPGPGSTGAPN